MLFIVLKWCRNSDYLLGRVAGSAPSFCSESHFGIPHPSAALLPHRCQARLEKERKKRGKTPWIYWTAQNGWASEEWGELSSPAEYFMGRESSKIAVKYLWEIFEPHRSQSRAVLCPSQKYLCIPISHTIPYIGDMEYICTILYILYIYIGYMEYIL